MKLDHDEFAQFWSRYPRKVAKIEAMKAFVKARKLASLDDILAGLERYRRTMPDEPEYRPHPASWLRAGRWMDEDDEPAERPTTASDWWDECQRLHGGACVKRFAHELKMRDQAS